MHLIISVDAKNLSLAKKENEKQNKSKNKTHKISPSTSPSNIPTLRPTKHPTKSPIIHPSISPSLTPSGTPRKPVNIVCQDSLYFVFGSYEYGGRRVTKNCAWITSQEDKTKDRQSKFCDKIFNGWMVQDVCPIACNLIECATDRPSAIVSMSPSNSPTGLSSSIPTMISSSTPSIPTTTSPSIFHTIDPSSVSSSGPSKSLSNSPSNSPQPTKKPSDSLSDRPSNNPSDGSSNNLTDEPSNRPSDKASNQPSARPSYQLSSVHPSTLSTITPSNSPSTAFSSSPTNNASKHPSFEPTIIFSHSPSITTSPSTTPSYHSSSWPSISPTTLSKITLGPSQTSAILEDGTLVFWGNNLEGQIGYNFRSQIFAPTKVANNIKEIAFGYSHTCVIFNTGDKLQCWGDNRYGQLGNDSIINSSDPVTVILGTNVGVRQVSLGSYHSCVVLENDELKCWGYNRYGQVGDGTTLDRKVPQTVNLGSGVKQVSLGDIHSCAVLINEEVKCWGNNLGGQLGDGSIITSSVPKAISVGKIGVRQVVLGGYHTCVVLKNNQLKCWGFNDQGQIGDGSSEENHPEPTLVKFYEGDDEIGVKQVSLGGYHTCAILLNDELRCWGANFEGQLGINSTVHSYSPQKVSLGVGTSLKKVVLGTRHSCALLDKGEMKCWGSNWSGQIGDNTTVDRLLPKSVLMHQIDRVRDVGNIISGGAFTKLNTSVMRMVALLSFLMWSFV